MTWQIPGILERIKNSWDLFGGRMLCSKAWEKYIIDPYRFRPGKKRFVPEFQARTAFPDEISMDAAENKLSILYLLHYFFPDKQGGTERFVLNLAKEQQKRGSRVRVITLGKRPRSAYSHCEGNIFWEEFEFEGIPITQIRYRRSPRGLYYDSIQPDDADMKHYAEYAINQYQPDVVHLAYPQPFAAFAAVCQKRGIPYGLTLTDFTMFCHYSTMVRKSGDFCDGCMEGSRCKNNCKTYGVWDERKRYKNAEQLLNGAGCITAPSEFVARVMEQEFSYRGIHVIPHGIAESFSPGKPRKKTRNFIYVGTLSNLKGVHLLIRAFQQISGDISLRIYGTGDWGYVRSLHRLAQRDERISFCGSVHPEEMPKIYQNADCVVVPSIWFETYNFVLREGLACGCLAVASRIGAMPEAVEVGKNGFLFEAGDEQDLTNALKKAMCFDWKYYRSGTFPSISNEADQHEVLYRSVCILQKELLQVSE